MQAGVVAYGAPVWEELQANMFESAVRALRASSTWENPAAMGAHCINACLVAMEEDEGLATNWLGAFLHPCTESDPAFYRSIANAIKAKLISKLADMISEFLGGCRRNS